MKKEQTLKKAIERAVKNGWKMTNKMWAVRSEDMAFDLITEDRVNTIIFSHSFAKAFFKGSKTRWDIHLQRMVIWPEPIKYLERCLGGDFL